MLAKRYFDCTGKGDFYMLRTELNHSTQSDWKKAWIGESAMSQESTASAEAST